MNPFSTLICTLLLVSVSLSSLSQAILVQPHNYMLDDSGILGANSQYYDRDSSDSSLLSASPLNSFRSSRAAAEEQEAAAQANDNGEPSLSHFSAEMAELIKNEQRNNNQEEPGSLSSSVAHVLMNVAQAAADEAAAANQAQAEADQQAMLNSQGNSNANNNNEQQQQNQQQSLMSLDNGSPNAKDQSSKTGPLWYNPKETIPVLKISSMATPSKYKKVYFRSEKKLVDGAFHSPSQTDKDDTKSFKRAFISSVQRRSSRGTSSSAAPPGILQDGVVEFLRKFRDVYVQTRPTGQAAASASSPFAAAFAPLTASFSASSGSSSSGRPTLMSALGAISSAASKVNSASAFGQAAAAAAASAASAAAANSNSALASPTSGSSAGSQLGAAASNVVASVVATPSSGASSPSKSPLSAQSYVSFWSKTFPTWVRKVLKQMRRRSLQNHNKRQQHNHAHATTTLGQAAQAAANVAQAVEQAASSSSSSSSGSSSSGH